jgi:hypothetical protein
MQYTIHAGSRLWAAYDNLPPCFNRSQLLLSVTGLRRYSRIAIRPTDHDMLVGTLKRQEVWAAGLEQAAKIAETMQW